MRIEIPGTGGVLECFSGDNPNGIFGEGFHRVVVDEAPRMGAAVLPAVMSTVTATGGKVRFAFNLDQGRRNWAIQGFLNARDGSDPNQGTVFLRTDQSPYVTPASIEAMRRTLPDRVFRALYMGEIQEDGAGVFRNVESVHGGAPESVAQPGREYVIGLDLARKTDYTVAIVMDTRFNHVVWVDRVHGEPWLTQADRIARLAQRYNNAVVVPDGTGVGDVLIAALTERNVRMRPVIMTGGHGITLTGVPKTTLIQNLIVAIENKSFTFPSSYEVLTAELKSYEYDTTTAGAIVYSAPDGLHDDCVIALALALWGQKSVFMGPTEWVPAQYKRMGGF
jgi:Terminase RNaseH-like domain